MILNRSAQAGRSQPRFHVNGKFHLVGLAKNLFAQTSGRKQFGLLAQAGCFLIKALFETVGACGNPPKDDSYNFAAYAIVLLVLAWVLIPAALWILISKA
jgi:hypothetical protein